MSLFYIFVPVLYFRTGGYRRFVQPDEERAFPRREVKVTHDAFNLSPDSAFNLCPQ